MVPVDESAFAPPLRGQMEPWSRVTKGAEPHSRAGPAASLSPVPSARPRAARTERSAPPAP